MPRDLIQLGVIGRPHGVRGLVRVTSHTADPADLTAYGPLSDGGKRRFTLRWKQAGIAEVCELVDGMLVRIADRSAAEELTNLPLFIERAALPPPAEDDEYYLADLIGLRAEDGSGAVLGAVSVVHDYGAGSSLEIQPGHGGAPLIVPFTRACVPVVDIAGGRVVVSPPHEIIVPPAAEEGAAA